MQSHGQGLRDRFHEVITHTGSKTQKDSNNIGVALELVLTQGLHLSIIERIICQESPEGLREHDYPWGANIASLEGGAVLRYCISSSPWILEHEHDTFFQAITVNDEEAALCLLLPSLLSLKLLHVYSYAPRVHDFIARIAKKNEGQILPSLKEVSNQPVNGEDGLSLKDLAFYAALPSVRTIIALSTESSIREGNFSWPYGLPLSYASRIVFLDSLVVRADVERWAAGFRGPCLMTQNWLGKDGQYPGGDPNPDWDRLQMTGTLTSATGGTSHDTRSIQIELIDDDPDGYRNSSTDHGVDGGYM